MNDTITLVDTMEQDRGVLVMYQNELPNLPPLRRLREQENPAAYIALCSGDMPEDRKRVWTNRLNYWSRKHDREYRVRYVPKIDMTVIMCTWPSRRTGPGRPRSA